MRAISRIRGRRGEIKEGREWMKTSELERPGIEACRRACERRDQQEEEQGERQRAERSVSKRAGRTRVRRGAGEDKRRGGWAGRCFYARRGRVKSTERRRKGGDEG